MYVGEGEDVYPKKIEMSSLGGF